MRLYVRIVLIFRHRAQHKFLSLLFGCTFHFVCFFFSVIWHFISVFVVFDCLREQIFVQFFLFLVRQRTSKIYVTRAFSLFYLCSHHFHNSIACCFVLFLHIATPYVLFFCHSYDRLCRHLHLFFYSFSVFFFLLYSLSTGFFCDRNNLFIWHSNNFLIFVFFLLFLHSPVAKAKIFNLSVPLVYVGCESLNL